MATIRNYNAWIRNTRAKYGISLKEARESYRIARKDLGRPLRGVDVKRHPRITGRAVRNVTRPTPKRIRTIDEYQRALEESDNFARMTIGAGVDTGRKKRRR